MRFLLAFILAAPLFAGATITATGPDQVSRSYTLKDHPRVWLDGPTGTITLRLKDPDGSGPLRNANYDAVTGQAMVSRVTSARSNCLVGGVIKNCRSIYSLATEAAMLWWMCNQCTTPWNGSITYLDFAKDLYLNFYAYGFKRWFGSHKFGDALAPDAGDDPSGMVDYGGSLPMQAAVGYSIIRDQLTSGERTTIARYFVNGLLPGDYCAYPSVRQTGRISKSGNTITLLDGSWPAEVAVGEWLDVKAYKDENGAVITTMQVTDNYWAVSGVIQSVSGNTLTMKFGAGASSMKNFQEGYYFTYPEFQSNTCGTMGIFLMHSDAPSYTEPSYTQNKFLLGENVPALDWDTVRQSATGVTQTIKFSDTKTSGTTTCSARTITGFSAPSPSTPWKAVIQGDWKAEVVLIEGISNCDLTVRRGLYQHGWAVNRCPEWDSICWSYNPNSITVMQHKGAGERLLNTGLNNRELTRAQSVLAIALAFADDDARAASMLEIAMSYFSTESYKLATQHFTLFNYSVGSYNIGRGAYYSRMAWFLQNSISSPAVTYTAGRHLIDQAYIYPYWVAPWAPKELLDIGLDAFESCIWRMDTSGTSANSSSIRDCSHIALMAQLMHPSEDATKYGWSFLTQNSSHAFHSSAASWAAGEYSGEAMTLWLALAAGYPTDIQTAADRTALNTTFARTHGQAASPGGFGYKIGVSRTDWTPNATYGFRIAFDSISDKLTGESTLSSYGIGKNGWLIYSPGFRQRFENNHFFSKIEFGNYTKAPYWPYCYPSKVGGTFTLTDGVCPGVTYPAYSTARSTFLWTAVDDTIVAKGGNVASGTFVNLHGLNRNWRHFVHIKGDPDFFIVFDDFDKTVSERFRIRTMYPQNGETVTSEGGRTWTEGLTSIASDFSQVETRTGTTEGGVETKLLHKWLFTGGTSVEAIYDIPVKITNDVQDVSQTLTPCADATVSQPCRVKVGASEWTFTAPPGTYKWYKPGAGMAYKRIYLTFDPADGLFKGRYQSPGPATPSECTGDISCTAAAPGADEIILASVMWGDNGFLDGCGYPQRIASSNGPFHHGTCHQKYNPFPSDHQNYGKYDNARSAQVQGAAATSGTVWQWMRATEDLSETLPAATEKSVTGTGANHKALQIEHATSPIVAVLPINNARATDLAFTTDHSGDARMMIAGLAESSTYTIARNGVDVATGLSTGSGEYAIYTASIAAGSITVTRTGGSTGNLEASVASVSKSATFGGANPTNQAVSISGVGASLGAWTATIVNSSAWVSFSGASSGTGNGSVTLAFSIAGRAVGTYNDTLRFTASGFSNSPLDVPITLTISAAGSPVITVTPTTLTFAAVEGGGNPSSQNVAVTLANGPLTVTVADDQTYCAASTSSFTGSTSATNVSISMTTGALTEGSYPCTVTFSATGATDKTVAVTFNVAAPAAITLNLGSVTNFETTVGGNAPDDKTLTFASAGGTLDNWTSSITYAQGSGWLSLSPSSGTTAANITVSVNPSSLVAAGTYCATVSIASTTANVSNSPATQQVCVDMLAPLEITISGAAGMQFNSAVSVGLAVTGGAATYTWSTSGGELPSGLALSSSTGATVDLSGTVTAIGDYPVTVGVYDTYGAQATVLFPIKVRPAQAAADVTVTRLTFAGGVILRIRKAGLNAKDVGQVVLRDNEGNLVAGKAIPAGLAVRDEVFTNLESSAPLTYEVCFPTGLLSSPAPICATGTFTVDAASADSAQYRKSITPPGGRSIVGIDVYMSTSQALVNDLDVTPTRFTCANPDPCIVSVSTTKGFRYYRHIWRDGSNNSRGDSGVQKVRIR